MEISTVDVFLFFNFLLKKSEKTNFQHNTKGKEENISKERKTQIKARGFCVKNL